MLDSHKVVEKKLIFLNYILFKVQRKSALQLAIPAIWLAPIFFMNGIDYSSSVIWSWIPFTCQPGKLKTQFSSPVIKSSTPGLLREHHSVYSLCTLFNLISLELGPLNAFLTTLLLGNTRQTFPMKSIKYLHKWLNKVVYHMLAPLHKEYRNDYSCIAYN